MESVSKPRSVRRARASGFTLPELMAVVAIIGVMAAIAIFSMKGYGNAQGSASLARSIQYALMTARTDALNDNRQRQLTCGATGCTMQIASSTGNGTVSTWLDAGTNISAGNHATIWNINYTTDVTSSTPGGSQMTGNKYIVFKPDGTATAATFYVDDQTPTNGNGNKYKVYVFSGTGMARLVNNWL